MTKQTSWIVGGEDDTFALIAGAAERDAYLRTGDWAAAGEPADGDWVYIWHEGGSAPGRYPVSALRDLWSRRGYVAGPPPGGTHPFTPELPAEQPKAEAKKAQESAGGDKGKTEKAP